MLDIRRTQTVGVAVGILTVTAILATLVGPAVGLPSLLGQGAATTVLGICLGIFGLGVLLARYGFRRKVRVQAAGTGLTIVGIILLTSFVIGTDLTTVRNVEIAMGGLVVYFLALTLYGYTQTGKDFSNWEITTMVLLVMTVGLVALSELSALLEPFAFITLTLSVLTHTLFVTGRTKRPDAGVIESGARLVTGYVGLPFELAAYLIEVVRRVRG